MVHVKEIMNVGLLSQMEQEGYVRRQKHPTLPLSILNYSEQAQFDKRWNEVTLQCRGLILDAEGNVVARPWKKFFNYGEGRLKIDDTMPVEVTDKMDGSLGILWRLNGAGMSWEAIATRGSFTSEQAIHASRIWTDRYSGQINDEVIDEYTFLFEIIYPQNRIVLNYGDMDDLVLLGAVHIERGYYLGPNEAAGILGWPGPVTQVFEYSNIAQAFAADPRPNAEGFVVRSGTEIVKIKQVDYVELHRIVTNLSPLTLWRRLSAGDTLSKLLEDIPDEWHEWLRTEYAKLDEAYRAVEARAWAEWSNTLGMFHSEVMSRTVQKDYGLPAERKNWARHIVKSKDKGYLFAILDKKPIDQMIWNEIRPKGDADAS